MDRAKQEPGISNPAAIFGKDAAKIRNSSTLGSA